MKIHLSTQEAINEAVKQLMNIVPNGEYSAEIKKLPKSRTIKQNASLWKYLEILSDELNSAGYEMVILIVGKEVHIPWTKDTLKEAVWNGIMKKAYKKNSSTDLTTSEMSEIYEIMNRWTATTFGIGVPWPNKQDMS